MKQLTPLFSLFLLMAACQPSAENTSAKTSTQALSVDDYFGLVREAYNADHAFATTAYIEKYFRVPGNSGFDSSIYYVESILKEAGFKPEKAATPNDRLTYRLEKRPMKQKTWEPVDASLTIAGESEPILSFSTNRNMININSFSTPEKGLDAEVVYLKSASDLSEKSVKGKIVLMEMHPFMVFKKAVMEQGALGVMTYNMPGYTQPEKHQTSIQFSFVPQDEEKRSFGLSLSYAAFTAMKKALEEGKKRVNVKIKTKLYEAEELTLVAQMKGSAAPEKEFVFSAHVQEPGANDNATGVACLAESARVTAALFKAKKIDPKRTITFLWGDEINSTNRYVEDDSERKENILWGVSLDMVGQNTAITGGTFLIEKMPDPSAIWTRGNDKHSEWGGEPIKKEDLFPHYFNDFAINRTKDQAKATGWTVSENPFEGGSDHVPFLEGGIPGLLFWHFTDVFYHTDNDRLENVSPETIKNVGVSSLVTALSLVSATEKTALAICAETKVAAIKRLQAEAIESKKAMEAGSEISTETEIISTWKDWYVASLQTIETLEIGTPSESTQAAIAKAKNEVEAEASKIIGELTK